MTGQYEGIQHSKGGSWRALSVARCCLIACLSILSSSLLSGCYIYNFFKDESDVSSSSESSAVLSGVVLGRSLGARTTGLDEAALAEVHATGTIHPPAPIRPDPDTFIRLMLRNYRTEGMTLARQIGSIEDYRDLLGGANEDFSKDASKEYDATSLLATMKVAERVCEGLVSPNAWEHEGWSTILPADPSDWETNISFLAQRFIGLPSSRIDSSVITELRAILDGFDEDGTYTLESYVPVCTALALDAEALYL